MAEPMMIEEDRYKRQILLWGEEGQQRLAKARVAVVGLEHQGVYTALCMAALGVGNIVLVDGSESTENEMFLDMELPRGPRAASYPSFIGKVNTQINIEGYVTDLEGRIDQLTLEGCDVIVDTTNSAKSKRLALQAGKENKVPVLSTSSRLGYTKLMLCRPEHNDPAYLMPMFEGQEQDFLMALSMCGVTTEEVKKAIFGDIERMIKDPVRYRLGQGYRFGFPEKGEELPVADVDILSSVRAAFLGGGALGCWGAIPGARMGFTALDIYDYDTFESHNINRQVLGFDGIGKLKAEHIAEKIRRMSRGKTASTGYNMLITPGFGPEKKYDVVFDFVDNAYTRAINSAYAVSHGIPLISAGALPNSARWDVHIQGQTQCMGCTMNIYEEGRREEMIRRASCAANPNPSVVMSNAIAAVNALLDTYTVFDPDKFGRPFNGQQTYRSEGANRFGTTPMNDPCACYSQAPPELEISDDDVARFAETNPEALRNRD